MAASMLGIPNHSPSPCTPPLHAGIPAPGGPDQWHKAMAAIKGVWASKYNDRAYFSLRKVRAHVKKCSIEENRKHDNRALITLPVLP